MTTELAALILSALLASIPRVPQPQRGRIERAHDQIVAVAARGANAHGVPPAVLLVVGMLETHLGQDDREGGNWGAPVDIRHRHTAGTPDHAARALARSFVVCGSWRGAVGRFRSGLCAPWQARHRAYVAQVVRLVERVHARVGAPLPDAWRADAQPSPVGPAVGGGPASGPRGPIR